MRRRCGEDKRLRLFGISKAGLLAMTISVCALWSVIALEASARHHAAMDALTIARTLDRLRQEPLPASEPARRVRYQTVRSS